MSKTINQILSDLIAFYQAEEKKELDKERPEYDRVRFYSWTAFSIQEGLNYHWTMDEAKEELDRLFIGFRVANNAKKEIQGQLDRYDYFYRSITNDIEMIQGQIHGITQYINIVSKDYNKWEEETDE